MQYIDSETADGIDGEHESIKANFFKTYDRRSQEIVVTNLSSPRASANSVGSNNGTGGSGNTITMELQPMLKQCNNNGGSGVGSKSSPKPQGAPNGGNDRGNNGISGIHGNGGNATSDAAGSGGTRFSYPKHGSIFITERSN